MKGIIKLAVVGAVLGIAVGANAADPYLSKFQPGTWKGKVTESVSPELKGKMITATTATSPEAVTVTVKFDGAKGGEREEWKITNNKLIQTEYDASGKAVGTYAANLRQGSNDAERVFDINCTDKAAKKCDNNIDPNNNWVVSVNEGKFNYVVRGLKDKANPTSVGERHRFEFQYAGK
ncbi:MAG: hypothetical protein HY540_03855 [Deltaproteobacteria bacterium]|nr:hypothetical protein [Deltaproteobacteria bacterium]